MKPNAENCKDCECYNADFKEGIEICGHPNGDDFSNLERCPIQFKITIRFRGKKVFHADSLDMDECLAQIEKWRNKATPMKGNLQIDMREISSGKS